MVGYNSYMSQLLIVQNISREGPGLLDRVLKDASIAYDVVDLDKGQPLPAVKNYKAVVVLGGPDSANDATPKMTAEIAWIKECLKAEIPYLGICLGLQILVKAAGGKVVPANVKEIGFLNPAGRQYSVEVTNVGRADPLFANLPDVLPVFQLHGETVEQGLGMSLLATGADCKNQIMKVADRAYGIQSHFELTAEMLTVWAQEDPDLKPFGKDKLLTDFNAIGIPYTLTGQTLLRNFLGIAHIL